MLNWGDVEEIRCLQPAIAEQNKLAVTNYTGYNLADIAKWRINDERNIRKGTYCGTYRAYN
ncbi:MAG: hypothetical protein K2I10_14705 [Lachnospiraceae bacterium]|nr:hypothetical protein [Lachnospiraceae bacterium]